MTGLIWPVSPGPSWSFVYGMTWPKVFVPLFLSSREGSIAWPFYSGVKEEDTVNPDENETQQVTCSDVVFS